MKSRLSRHLRIGFTRDAAFSTFRATEAADFDAAAAEQPLGHDPKLAARDDAVFLLHAAAEVEHALMVQYLYAAYSLGGPQVPQDKQEIVRGWKRTILDIAREEMGHLASVQNLLRFIGGPLNLEREDFPFRTGLYPFRFKLERLTKASLAKYVYAEMPEDLSGADIDEIRRRALGASVERVNHVGRLYHSIASLFRLKDADGSFSIKDGDLQAEPAGYQAGEEWAAGRERLIIRRLRTREGQDDGAIPLIEAIAAQGEGLTSTTGMQKSHYQLFREIYDVFPEETDWKPSRLVAENPNTTEPDPEPDAVVAETELQTGRITNPRARVWAQLLNLRYRILLTYIFHALHLDSPPDKDPKSTLMMWLFREMSTNIKKISGFLVEMPQREGDASGPPFAAPPFELPYTFSLADSAANRWRLQRDLFIASQMLIRKVQEVETDSTSQPFKFLEDLSKKDADALLFAETQIRPAPPTPFVPTSFDMLAEAEDTKRFTAVKTILEDAVAGQDIDAHGNFWRGKTRDQFVALKVFGRPLMAMKADGTFDENESNLVKALQGRSPFGVDTGTAGATFRRMPAGLDAVSPEKIEIIRQWIKDGCPDDASQ
jgi:hypothetical protein